MERHDCQVAGKLAESFYSGTQGNQPLLTLRFQLLYLFLYHGFLGLETLGKGNRLDGTTRNQPATGSSRSGMRVEKHARKARLHQRRNQQIHCRTCFLGMVGHEQPGRMGRSQSRQLVHTAGSTAEEDSEAYARIRHRTGISGLFRYGTSRCQ